MNWYGEMNGMERICLVFSRFMLSFSSSMLNGPSWGGREMFIYRFVNFCFIISLKLL